MDCYVRLARFEREFQFLDEQTFAAQCRKRRVEFAITLGCHSEQLNLDRWISCLQTGCYMTGLPHRQGALACGNNDFGWIIQCEKTEDGLPSKRYDRCGLMTSPGLAQCRQCGP